MRSSESTDINAPSEPVWPARPHPVREFINHVRDTWVSMGFIETMGPIVETAFWNFDALFSPQDHPTRDMQDTFFPSNPKEIEINDLALMKRVKNMHVTSWESVWQEELARQPVLRTHTTSVSAHNIQRLANAVGDSPLKLFSIGKVFRNESLDYKHLAELHQFDGIIIERSWECQILYTRLRSFIQTLALKQTGGA